MLFNYTKHITLLALVIFSFSANSQVVLKMEDMISEGDTVRLSIATDPEIDFITTGPQSNWDFSYLVADEQRLVEPLPVSEGGFLANVRFGPNAGKWASNYYMDFLGLPLDQLGGFLPVDIDDVYRFSKLEEDSITYTGLSIGVSGNILPFRSDTIELAYPLPLTFGDSYTSNGYTRMDLNPIFDALFIQRRQRFSEVDGYGSVTTALGTFNAIRVHHIIDEQDSIYVNLGNFDQWLPINQPRVHQYEWWTKFQDLPVIKIETREVNGNETVTEIAYRDVYLGLDAAVEEVTIGEVNFFPNPADSKVEIRASLPIQDLVVYGMNGKEVFSKYGGNDKNFSIDVSSWKSGVYLVKVSSKEGSVFKKLVVQ